MPRNPNCRRCELWKGSKPGFMRLWNRMSKPRIGCWIWPGHSRRGVATYCHSHASRIVYELSTGRKLGRKCALHRCDNQMCVRPSHLFKGTRADNNRDRNQKGRTAHGESMPHAVLNPGKVRLIHAMKREGHTRAFISEVVGASRTQVFKVLNGKAWTHVSV